MRAKDFVPDDEAPASRIERRRFEPVEVRRRSIPVALDFSSRVPRIAISLRDLSLLPLDHREGFLLSLVDGRLTVESILDICAMPAEEALGTLSSLIERRIVVVD